MKTKITIICFLACLLCGCSTGIQPIPHPEHGTKMMIVPKGTKIGDQVAPEDGLFIGESRIIVVEEDPKVRT